LLLIAGLAGLAGTYVIGLLLRKALYGLLIGMPVAMAAIAVGLAFLGWSVVAVAVLLALWGLIATAAPVGWWTWMSKVLPDDAEAGGGLMVAVIQLSITVGASVGGLLFDSLGYRASFAASAALLGLSALVALLASRRATASNSRSWREAAVQPA
jgi:predicted MFS family arabinose efflux permease